MLRTAPRGLPKRLMAPATLLAAAMLVSLWPPAAAGSSADRPPNVIVVLTDDQDDRTLWAMPKLQNRMIAHGTRFTNSYVSFPLCCAARATLLTGQYAHNHEVVSNVARMEGGGYPALDHSDTLPIWLRNRGELPREGYRTAHVGRHLNGYGNLAGRGGELTRRQARRELPPGWDRWFAPVIRPFRMYDYALNQNGNLVRYGQGARNYQTDVLARHATRLIRRFADRPRPLFLTFAPLAPHGEIPAPETGPNPRPAPRHRNAYSQRKLPRPPSFNRRDAGKPPHVSTLPPITREQRRDIIRRHRGRLASLRAVDDAIGDMVGALRQAGELRNTLFIFTSDQGFMRGQHRVAHGKVHPYEETVRVPLVVRAPGLGVERGAVRDDLIANVDLAATALEVAGLEPPFALDDGGRSSVVPDGVPLPPFESPDPDRAILLQDLRPGGDRVNFRAIRAGSWSLIQNDEDSSGPGERFEELYELDTDPFQLDNLAGAPDEPSNRLELLRAGLDELDRCAGPGCRVGVELP